MPDYDRHAPEDDLDIATRVMDTVQRQIGAYRDALMTVRRLRRQLVAHEKFAAPEQEGSRQLNTPEKLSEYFEEHGIPRPLSIAFRSRRLRGDGRILCQRIRCPSRNIYMGVLLLRLLLYLLDGNTSYRLR